MQTVWLGVEGPKRSLGYRQLGGTGIFLQPLSWQGPTCCIAQVAGFVLGLQSTALHGALLSGVALGREVLPAVFSASVGVFRQLLRS